jgi:hypothetical protein
MLVGLRLRERRWLVGRAGMRREPLSHQTIIVVRDVVDPQQSVLDGREAAVRRSEFGPAGARTLASPAEPNRTGRPVIVVSAGSVCVVPYSIVRLVAGFVSVCPLEASHHRSVRAALVHTSPDGRQGTGGTA